VIDDGNALNLVNGATVEVHGAVVAGVIVASRVEIKRAAIVPPIKTPPPSADTSFEATGAVSGFISVASFKVSGITIDASSAEFKDGSAANLKNGVTVEVKGTLSGGIVQATRVQFKR